MSERPPIDEEHIRRLREDLLDSLDEELEMELDDRALDPSVPDEDRVSRARTSESFCDCKASLSNCRTGWWPSVTAS